MWRILFGLMLLSGTAFGMVQPFPFSDFPISGGARVFFEYVGEAQFRFFDQDKSRAILLPEKFYPLYAFKQGKENLLLGRSGAEGELSIVKISESGSAEILSIPKQQRENIFLKAAGVFKGKIFLVSYNISTNSPSGTGASILKDHFSLLLLDCYAESCEARSVSNALSLGGIDSTILVRLQDDSLVICGGENCLFWQAKIVGSQMALSLVDRLSIAGHGLTQLSGNSTVLFKCVFDDRLSQELDDNCFKLMDLKTKVVTELSYNDVLIYLSESLEKNPNRNNIKRLLFNQLLYSQPHNGMGNLGGSNIEGRIAWEHTYTIDALASVLKYRDTFSFLDAFDLQNVKQRLSAEVDSVVRYCLTDFPGFYSKRYSLRREATLSVVHLGRILASLNRAREFAVNDDIEVCTSSLTRMLYSFEETLEHGVPGNEESLGNQYLKFKKGVSFWPDGANVPYNYQSAYIEGLLSQEMSAEGAEKRLTLVYSMLKLFIDNEKLGDEPKMWRYWWGLAFNGWKSSDNVSLNTPEYAGDKRNTPYAHISYRTMDAKALLMAHRQNPLLFSCNMINYLAGLGREGLLLPSINAGLLPFGRLAKPSTKVLIYYSIPHSSAEIEEAVWALSLLEL